MDITKVTVPGGKPMSFLDRIVRDQATLPNRLRVPDAHVLDEVGGRESFRAKEHYFAVRVASLQLAYSREWFSTWDPMLLAVTEFMYNGAQVTVPFVIGSSLLKQKKAQVPDSMAYVGTNVSGVHPYAGGGVAVTVILYRVRRDDYLRSLLHLVEKAAAAFGLSTVLAEYLVIGNVIADGIDLLLGQEDTQAMLGLRQEFDPNVGDDFRPGSFALVSGRPLGAERLWVRDSDLVLGDDGKSAMPIGGEDHVLFSIRQVPRRNDVMELPWLRPLWEQMDGAANTGLERHWEVAKGYLGVLYEKLHHSPDLTPGQARDEYAKLASLLRETYEVAKDRTSYAQEGDKAATNDPVLDQVANIVVG